ncbi:MAG: sigma-70 family RNA polymerase sigma factor [Acidiphilium sp.]|nr:sigma-70 family RNA polymerase sigma factor [Acidiphilium sp.]MDD4935530.1 sigma-70 family RNA polymerase sigma factor [Acidiphilium sp.]
MRVVTYKMFDGTELNWVTENVAGMAAEDDLTQLLRRCAERDPLALRALYDAMAPTMLGVALRLLRNRPHAEETLQDAFLQIWRNADRFDTSRGSPKAWMIGILRYRALDRLETERRHTGTDELPDVAADMPVDIEDSRALSSCIGELPENWRRSVVLSYVEGYSHSEIADLTKTPLGTIKSWIVRALDALKKCLER